MSKKSEFFEMLLSELSDTDILKADLCHQISSMIYSKRKEMNKNQKEFANFMGVSQAMVSKWESFEYNFTIESIAEIFSKLNINVGFVRKSDIFEYKTLPVQKYNNDYNFKISDFKNIPKGA